MKIIDINCDMGEGAGSDESLMPFISSANIACGYHAGDEETMRETIRLCKEHRVAIGAHPSFPDRENFGRTDMHLEPANIYDLITAQLNIINEIAKSEHVTLDHVKPHGALFNMAARDLNMSAAIALAVKDFDEKLILFGLSGSHLIMESKKIGLKAWNEVFADRTYKSDGSLSPRSKPNAMIENAGQAVQQVLQMINEHTVTAVDGSIVQIIADTVCIHGDGPHALEFAKAIFHTLKENNIVIRQKQ